MVFKEANTDAYNSEVARVIARFEGGDVILQISLQSQAQGFFSCSLEQILSYQCAGATAVKWE